MTFTMQVSVDSSFYGLLRQDLALFLSVPSYDIQFSVTQTGRRLLASYLQVQVTYSTQNAANAGVQQVNSDLSTFNSQLKTQGIASVTLISTAQAQSVSSSSSNSLSTTTIAIIASVGGAVVVGALIYSMQQQQLYQQVPIQAEATEIIFIEMPPHLQLKTRNS